MTEDNRITKKGHCNVFIALLTVLACIATLFTPMNTANIYAGGLLKDNIGKQLRVMEIGDYYSASTWKKGDGGGYTEFVGHGDRNKLYRAEGSDEALYCVQMREPFRESDATVKNMSELIDNSTIKRVSAALYYFDINSSGLSARQKEQGKQCIVWTFIEYLGNGKEKVIKVNESDSAGVNAVLDKLYSAFERGELSGIINDITTEGSIAVPISGTSQILGAFYYNYNPTGSIKIRKSDSVLGATKWMSADGLLAEFDIINRSGRSVTYNGKTIADGNVLGRVKTSLQSGTYSVTISNVPYGKYEVKEVSAGKGYVVKSHSDYVTVSSKDEHVVDVSNVSVRGDIAFEKLGENGNKLSVPFLITNKATKEAHVVVTKDGAYSSKSVGKSDYLNINDSIIDKADITDADYDYSSRVWFSKGDNGIYPYLDGVGAFPYGDYRAEELRCRNNIGYALESFEFSISEHGTVKNIGEIVDKNIDIHTMAIDKNTGIRTGIVGNTTIVDTISYTNLTIGREYTISGELVDKETGMAIDIEGAQSSTTCIPSESDGNVEIYYNIDASTFAGREVVVFEDLYSEGKLIATHADINDENQTVSFPHIKTEAADKNTNTMVGVVGKTSIVDTVSYTNLVPGVEYLVKGELIDKSTGERVEDIQNAEVSTTFIPDMQSGNIEMEYNIDSAALAGREVVVYEYLYYNDALINKHTDIDDEYQTVIFPSIVSKASDTMGSSDIKPNERVNIVDTIHYSNLVDGEGYVLHGSMVNKKTGEMLDCTSIKEFVADKSGEVKVEFQLDTKDLGDNDIVVYQELYDANGVKLEEHKDINNKEQTLKVLPEEPDVPLKHIENPIKPVNTGDTTFEGINLLPIIVIISAIGIGVTILVKRKYK